MKTRGRWVYTCGTAQFTEDGAIESIYYNSGVSYYDENQREWQGDRLYFPGQAVTLAGHMYPCQYQEVNCRPDLKPALWMKNF